MMLLVLKLPNQGYIKLRTLRMMPLFSRMSHELVLLRAFAVLYMSFDKFLLAFESRDLSQADKILIRVPSFDFPKLSEW